MTNLSVKVTIYLFTPFCHILAQKCKYRYSCGTILFWKVWLLSELWLINFQHLRWGEGEGSEIFGFWIEYSFIPWRVDDRGSMSIGVLLKKHKYLRAHFKKYFLTLSLFDISIKSVENGLWDQSCGGCQAKLKLINLNLLHFKTSTSFVIIILPFLNICNWTLL